MEKIKVTIGIPTYEAGESLVKTVSSLLQQTSISSIERIIIAVDGNSMKPGVKKKLQDKKVKIIFAEKREGQATRMNDILQSAKTSLLVLTNDDVVLDKKAVEEFIKAFQEKKVDLMGARVRAFPPKSFFQKVIQVGIYVNESIASRWNKGDNYLTFNGRLICLSEKLYTKVRIPSQIWNNDAFLFIFAKLRKFKYSYVPEALVFYRSPSTLDEHMKQSNKFKNSYKENQSFFETDIKALYRIPSSYVIRALFESFKNNLIHSVSYVFLTAILSFKHIFSGKQVVNKVGYWQTDLSTKKL